MCCVPHLSVYWFLGDQHYVVEVSRCALVDYFGDDASPDDIDLFLEGPLYFDFFWRRGRYILDCFF